MKKSTAQKLAKQEAKQLAKASEKLQSLVKGIVSDFTKIGEKIEKARAIGKEEGFNDMQIGDMIRAEMIEAGWSKSTIQRHLPEIMKHVEKIRSQTPKSAVIMTTNPTEQELADISVTDQPQQPEREIASNSLQNTNVYTSEQQQEQQQDPEPETDSQRIARKYQEPQEEQSVREYGITIEGGGRLFRSC